MRIYDAKIVFTVVSEGDLTRLDTPAAVAAYLASAFEANPVQEAFYAVYLDRKNCPQGRHLISQGTLTSTLVTPREVFRGAILANAAAIIVSHNHPSGDPTPSPADIQLTGQLRQAAAVLDIELLDHVIVGSRSHDPRSCGFYSFREAGML